MASKLSRRPSLRALDALAGPHGVDGFLEQVDPLLVTGERRARVTAVARTAAGSITLTLRPNRAWDGFRAGQFVRVGVEIDGVRHQRYYSPASAEGERRQLEITVGRHPGGLVSNFLADRAEPGMVLDLAPAEGGFVLPRPRPAAVLLIGGGSGLTPLTAIARSLLGEGYRGPLALLQYAPDPDRAVYREQLDRLAAAHANFILLRSYTRRPGAGELDGHFEPGHLPGGPDFAAAETFACGPPGLLEAVREAWPRRPERLHVESFVPPSFAPAGEPGEGTIRFARSGREVASSGASLLEQAEAAGVEARFGCRMGICHTCTRRKLSGTHRNLVTGEESAEPDQEIQLCVSAALGDLALDL